MARAGEALCGLVIAGLVGTGHDVALMKWAAPMIMAAIAFLVLGLIGVYWCNELYRGKILGESASKHGEQIDTMMYITIAITGVVFVITQILLLWFAYKYQYSENRTAYYFPHDNRLEIIWTVVPAIALTVLVGFGLFYWFRITGEAPADAGATALSH